MECASGIEQRIRPRNAAVKDAPTPLKIKAYARGMKQRSKYASMKDAQTRQEMEEWIV